MQMASPYHLQIPSRVVAALAIAFAPLRQNNTALSHPVFSLDLPAMNPNASNQAANETRFHPDQCRRRKHL
jgi:hypothetical protein